MRRAIFFDASETLIHIPLGVAHHYRLVVARHGIEIEEEKLANAFRSVWRSRPLRPASAGPRPDEDKNSWRELVRHVLARCDVDPAEGFADLFEELYAHFAMPGVWELYPDVIPTLGALRDKYRLGIISNFDRRLYSILDQLGIAADFQAVIISSEVGADKPDPLIFQFALDRLGVTPGEAMHVGDDPVHDWQGAEEARMRCFRLDREANSLLDLLSALD
ncbi:MAG: hypothetical protein QOD99_96 [Chthoniobacter sp.]|nr:hypothetical protein [Chthoniobacter sp.]